MKSFKYNSYLHRMEIVNISESKVTKYSDYFNLPLRARLQILRDGNSDIYKMRSISLSAIETTVEIVNKALELAPVYENSLWSVYDSGLIPIDNNLIGRLTNLSTSGYCKARLQNLTYKVLDFLCLANENVGCYSGYIPSYLSIGGIKVVEGDVTFIPCDRAKAYFDNHSATDYKTVLLTLQLAGVIQPIVDYTRPHTFFGGSTRLGEIKGTCKGYWFNPVWRAKFNKESEVTQIDAHNCYSPLIAKIKSLPYHKLACIDGVLMLKPSERILKAAHKRLQASDSISRQSKVKVRSDRYSIEMTYITALNLISMDASDLMSLLRFTIDNYSGRFHTLLTRLSSIAREELTWANGEKVAEVDFQSCQPSLFCALLASKGFPELGRYVGDKDFYSVLNSLRKPNWNLNTKIEQVEGNHRIELKQSTLQGMYGLGNSHIKFIALLSKVVKAYNPNDQKRVGAFQKAVNDLVYGNRVRSIFIRGIKSYLPKHMQKLEVKMMFDSRNSITRRLLNEEVFSFTTIHDALLVPESKAEVARDIMHEVSVKFGVYSTDGIQITPKVKILG